MSSFISLQNIIYPSNELPLTMILLEDWSMVYIEGSDSKEYLQNQFTTDMNLLQKTQHTLCAHCNFNGKVLSTMRLFHYQKGYGYVQRKSISQDQITELKKYSVFSKIKIHELNNIYLIGLAGLDARLFLLNFFETIPDQNCPVIYEKNIVILWFSEPLERFLLILSESDFFIWKKKIDRNIFINHSKQWLLLDIEAGFPIIDKESSKKFTPQAINLDKLKAISFKKGCYYGQETIARIFFKKLNKRYLCSLMGKGNFSPKIGSFVEIKIGKNWSKIGFLLSIVHIKNKRILLQTVLYQTIEMHNIFRICGFEKNFSVQNI